MKKVIVIGALGFIGFALCQQLLEEEYEVIGIDQKKMGNEEKIQEQKLSEIVRNGNFSFIENQIENIALETLSDKCDVIYYCLNGDQDNQENNAKLFVNNKSRINKVMDYCQKVVCKFIYLSSYEVFIENEKLPNENSRNAPRNIIGKVKAEEEKEIITFSQRESHFAYIILRLPTIYGPWQPETMTYQQLINGYKSPIMDSIKEDAIYIKDLVDLLLAIPHTLKKNKTILLSSNKKNQWHKGFKLLSNLSDNNLELEEEGKLENKDLKEREKDLNLFQKYIQTSIEDGIELQKQHNFYLQKLKSLDLL